MSDPYKVLGVTPSATDEEIKKAYRQLSKKYHPDNYANSPLEDLASEKMQEINAAYDEITKERRNGGRRSSGAYGYGSGTNRYEKPHYNAEASDSGNYTDVRNLIRNNRLTEAEEILEGVPESNRDAEWHFLRGVIYKRKGWSEEAFNSFSTAHRMDPMNKDYIYAVNSMRNQRSGVFGGYNPNGEPKGCTGCDICSSILCADCCCECLGGDMIRCC